MRPAAEVQMTSEKAKSQTCTSVESVVHLPSHQVSVQQGTFGRCFNAKVMKFHTPRLKLFINSNCSQSRDNDLHKRICVKAQYIFPTHVWGGFGGGGSLCTCS